MAATYGEIALSNGQMVGVVYATNAPFGTVLLLEPNGAAVSTSNAAYFMVKSPCRIVDWIADGITSGKMELLSNGKPTGKFCDVRQIDIALNTRTFPRVGLRPGVKYAIKVVETFVD